MITEVDIKYLKQKQYISEKDDNYLYGFQKVNVFIGSNNSGKSRFLRSLLLSLPQIIKVNRNVVRSLINSGPELIGLLDNLYRNTKEPLFNYHSTNLKAVIYEGHQIPPIIFLSKLLPGNLNPNEQLGFPNELWFSNNLAKVLNLVGRIFSSTYVENLSNTFENYYYIPVLRGLKPLQKHQGKYIYELIYTDRIKYDYPEINKVYSGLEVFEEIKQRLLGDEKERQCIKEFEEYISDNLFGDQITLIPKYGDDILNIKIGSDSQRSIVHLGDGLQALICILFPIFIAKDNEYYFFIEEPELNLHPQLQRKLINLLSAPIFNQHQYFITSHSAHIIDHENASIYNFTKEGDKTKITHLDNQSKIVSALNTMGYTPSDLLQTNFIIWVEGETDKMIINYLIGKFYSNLKENLHYSIMFFGGSGDKHLLNATNNFEFIFALNRNCAIIKDSDRTKASDDVTNKENKFKALEKLGVLTWLTSKREIENHISKEDFIKAIRLQQKNENLEIIEPTPYGDYYKVKNINEVNQPYSPKRYIYLSEGLFKEIGNRKGNLTKSDADLIKNELQKSIHETKNIIPIKDKVAVIEKLIEIGCEVDYDLEAFINRLCIKIKEINQIK